MAIPEAPLSEPTGAEEGALPRALIVDDAAVERRVVGALLEGHGWEVTYADNGLTGLAAVERDDPQLILTDLHMPGLDGLGLVAAVRRQHPHVPVILMTAFGSEDSALAALRAGAAGYVPKRSLEQDLLPVLEQVLSAARAETREERLMERLERAELHFVLDPDPGLIPALVAHLQQQLAHIGLCDQTGRTCVGIALEEALVNALYHGSLEVGSPRSGPGAEAFFRLVEERRRQPPYRDRVIHCTARVSHAAAIYEIRDEGPGFNWAALPSPTDPANLDRPTGRGLLLIHSFVDEVRYNDRGNQVTLIKRREQPPTGQPEPPSSPSPDLLADLGLGG